MATAPRSASPQEESAASAKRCLAAVRSSEHRAQSRQRDPVAAEFVAQERPSSPTRIVLPPWQDVQMRFMRSTRKALCLPTGLLARVGPGEWSGAG